MVIEKDVPDRGDVRPAYSSHTTIILATVNALWYLATGLLFVILNEPSWTLLFLVVSVTQTVIVLIFATGIVRLARGNPRGRPIVTMGCLTAIFVAVVGSISTASYRAGIHVGAGANADVEPIVSTQDIASAFIYALPAVITVLYVLFTAERQR
jgi:hypothetical protein